MIIHDLVLACMFAHASCTWQTNMMVRPLGNYSFLDYTKFGILLQFGATLVAVFMTMALIS
jgi:hypothetical protein